MKKLWQSLFELSCAASTPTDARRIANLALACHIRQASSASGAEFTGQAKDVASTLGTDAKVPKSLWMALHDLLQEQPAQEPETSEIDGWIEAFQAADPARKTLGAYATPAPFGDALALETLKPLLSKGRKIRVVDPAVGAGSLLLAAYRVLLAKGYSPLDSVYSLYGVELDPAARELCVLLLWVAARDANPSLSRIADQVTVANALTLDWWSQGHCFDAVLMNPPWESLRHEAEDPQQARVRSETVARLGRAEVGAPDLPLLYTAHGRGDRNLFKAFVELAPHLLREGGRLGALLPAAFGSDDGMEALRERYLDQLELEKWTSFENRAKLFQIDSRYKFGLLTGTRSRLGTSSLRVRSFSVQPDEVGHAHVELSREDLDRIGGAGRMIPELASELEREVLGCMLGAGTPFFGNGPLGTIKYKREVDLTLGRRDGLFWHVTEPSRPSETQSGLFAPVGDQSFVPVLEGRMIGQYDCFQKSWVSGEGRRAVWEPNGHRPLEECQPQFVSLPRMSKGSRVAICDITSATNTRTVLASLVPPGWVCGNTAPVLLFKDPAAACAGLAILNSMVFDWFARRMVGGLHLNKFYLARLTWPALTPTQVTKLAELGRAVAASHPRGGLPRTNGNCSLTRAELISAMADIEAEVARGYRLSACLLKEMLAHDRQDRRGMWRYFDCTEYGRTVADAAVERLGSKPEPPRSIAA